MVQKQMIIFINDHVIVSSINSIMLSLASIESTASIIRGFNFSEGFPHLFLLE